MRKGSLQLTVIFSVLAIAVVVGIILFSGGLNSNSSPTPTPIATAAVPTMTTTPIPTSNPTATPNSTLTVTYSEQPRNQTMIVIRFKLEPNSYIFQMNATSFTLNEGGATVSTNINDAVVVGTEYSTLYFPINSYSGTDYHMSSDALPADTVWIKQ